VQIALRADSAGAPETIAQALALGGLWPAADVAKELKNHADNWVKIPLSDLPRGRKLNNNSTSSFTCSNSSVTALLSAPTRSSSAIILPESPSKVNVKMEIGLSTSKWRSASQRPNGDCGSWQLDSGEVLKHVEDVARGNLRRSS